MKWRATSVAIALTLSFSAHAAAPCDIDYPSDAQLEWHCETLRKGETLEKRFGAQWADVARFNRIDRRHAYPGMRIKAPMQLEQLATFNPLPQALLEAENDAQLILVDLAEQFLGAYSFGRLEFAVPITSGRANEPDLATPNGDMRIDALHRARSSSLYKIEGTDTPYPMNFALRFFVTRHGVQYWIHGRDLPGYPVSHGCIGLYDEAMQRDYYGVPADPQLADAKRLYLWVLGARADEGKIIFIDDGPRVLIRGYAPLPRKRASGG
jgi:hypothetical protein